MHLFSVEKSYSDGGAAALTQEKLLAPSSHAVWFFSYKLLKSASVPDFLLALEECHNEVLSKKKGFISWDVLVDGDTWVDVVTWETMEDAVTAESDDGEPDPVAQKFYSFMNFNTLKMRNFSVEKSYELGK